MAIETLLFSCTRKTSPSAKKMTRSPVRKTLVLQLLAITLNVTSGNRSYWESPGCHLVGNTRTVSIPNCALFNVATNACRGFCVSYAFPSSVQTLGYNHHQIITSRAECCSIQDSNQVQIWVNCIDGHQLKTFKSAKSCACSICRRT